MLAVTTAALAFQAPHSAPPDRTAKPVKVFILMGQSNMLGEGRIGTLTPAEPDKEQAELLPQQEATATALVGAGATCAGAQSWWVNVSFALGRRACLRASS